jgi:chromosome partitioning protein
MARPGQLDHVASSFDVVGIDCPGRDGKVVRAALMVADLVIVPCGASPADAWTLAQTLELIDEAKALRPNLQVCVVVTRRRPTGIGKGARGDLLAAGVPVLDIELAERVAYQQAMGEGRGVTASSSHSAAAKEIAALAEALIQINKETHVQEGTTHVA